MRLRDLAWLPGCLLLIQCAGSRPYKPLPWEKNLYKTYAKRPLPDSIREDRDKGKDIHWLGIIDSFWVEGVDTVTSVTLKARHHYWDYVEDFSIQREKMFVSPLGAGGFLFRRAGVKVHPDSMRKDLAERAHKGNLGLFYGKFVGREEGLPVLSGIGVRFVHRQFYSTGIWSYMMAVDASGKEVMQDFNALKLPGPGINDPEDKEFE